MTHLMKVVFSLLVIHVVLEGLYTNSSFIVDILLALLIGKELLRWKLGFNNPNPLLWVLHTGLYWVPLAFMLGGVTNLTTLLTGMNFLALDIHVLILGFVFTILIGFGTRVTIGHSGNQYDGRQMDKISFLQYTS